MSFSSVEDVYEILNKLDVIIQDSHEGNKEAIALVEDFRRLIIKSDLQYSILDFYISYQNETNCFEDNCFKSIIEVISEKLNLSLFMCRETLFGELQILVNSNYNMWLDWFDNHYYVAKDCKIKKPLESKIEIKFQEPYKPINTVPDIIPNDLQQLIKEEKNNLDKLLKLEEFLSIFALTVQEAKEMELLDIIGIYKDIKEYKDIILIDGKFKRQIKREKKIRVRMKIDLYEKISLLKKSYGFPVQKTNTQGQKSIVSFNNDFVSEEIVIEDNLNNLNDSFDLEIISDTAKKVLTNRQYVIYSLYYVSGLTQQEIANIVETSREHITQELKNILYKIKKNM